MSARGSFITELIYCKKCFKAMSEVFLRNDGEHMKIVFLAVAEERMPIIAGKTGGTDPGDVYIEFDVWYAPNIQKVICHPVRIAVLSDGRGERIYFIGPVGKVIDYYETDIESEFADESDD